MGVRVWPSALTNDPSQSQATVSDLTSPFEKHVFVCTSGEYCPLLDGNSKGVNNSGCLDQCGHGPNVVIYPDNIWYSHLTIEDVPIIVQEHLINGRPVERLRYHPPKPGANKLKRDANQHRVAEQIDGCRADWLTIPRESPRAGEPEDETFIELP